MPELPPRSSSPSAHESGVAPEKVALIHEMLGLMDRHLFGPHNTAYAGAHYVNELCNAFMEDWKQEHGRPPTRAELDEWKRRTPAAQALLTVSNALQDYYEDATRLLRNRLGLSVVDFDRVTEAYASIVLARLERDERLRNRGTEAPIGGSDGGSDAS